MACFLVPTAEAIGVSIAQHVIKRRTAQEWKVGWLSRMLWGGAALLAAEHAIHKEIVPWPPFLTSMSSPEETIVMLKEMAMVGIPMAVVITIVWAVVVALVRGREKVPAIEK